MEWMRLPEQKLVRSSSVGRALVILGDRWTWLILRAAFLGARRFQDWQAALGLSDPLLASRLRSLVAAGILARVPCADHRARHEYHLTGQGLDLWASLVAIWAWETSWVSGRADTAPLLIHGECGQSITPRLACGSCGRVAAARDVSQRPGPGAGMDAAPRARHHRLTTQPGDSSDSQLYESQTMAVIGDRWSAAVLAASFAGIRRFTDFQRELHIPPYVLTQRLKSFLAIDIVYQVATATNRSHHEYRLSAKGLALFPVLMLLMQWADQWLAGSAGPPLEVTHQSCGQDLRPELQCSACGLALQRRAVHFTDRSGRPASVLRTAAGPGQSDPGRLDGAGAMRLR